MSLSELANDAQVPACVKHLVVVAPSKLNEALATLSLFELSVITNLSPLLIITSSVYNVPPL